MQGFAFSLSLLVFGLSLMWVLGLRGGLAEHGLVCFVTDFLPLACRWCEMWLSLALRRGLRAWLCCFELLLEVRHGARLNEFFYLRLGCGLRLLLRLLRLGRCGLELGGDGNLHVVRQQVFYRCSVVAYFEDLSDEDAETPHFRFRRVLLSYSCLLHRVLMLDLREELLDGCLFGNCYNQVCAFLILIGRVVSADGELD